MCAADLEVFLGVQVGAQAKVLHIGGFVFVLLREVHDGLSWRNLEKQETT